jgi:hypothetical protein
MGRSYEASHERGRDGEVVEDGRVVGVLAQADIAKQSDDAKTGELVEQISK